MGFIKEEIVIDRDIKVLDFLMQHLKVSLRDAKRMVDRKRIAVNGIQVTKKSYKIPKNSKITLISFKPNGYGLKPIFETKDFAIFDKPFDVAVHPKNLNNSKTLLDDVRELFGNEANLVHRLDKETSGLIIASKNKISEIYLKQSFEEKNIQKKYLLLAKGKIKSPMTINAPIKTNKDFENIKLKVYIDQNGKEAITHIKPLKYIGNNTLIEATPLTGRQHQIRVHMFHINHPIIGDPLYGVDTQIAKDYLDKKLSLNDRIKFTGAKRLLLHAYKLDFIYQKRYLITSLVDFEKTIKESI